MKLKEKREISLGFKREREREVKGETSDTASLLKWLGDRVVISVLISTSTLNAAFNKLLTCV